VRRRRLLLAALAGSLALHVVLLVVPLDWDMQLPPMPQVLSARLAPKPEAPAPKPQPPAPKPEPPAAKAAPPPKPMAKAAPSATSRPKAAQPVPTPTPVPPPVIQATPQSPAAPEAPRTPSAPSTPAPAPSATPAPSAAPSPSASGRAEAAAVDEANLIAQYRIEIIEVAIRLRRYPRIAEDNRWEGTSEVRLTVGADGGIAALATRKGSSYKVLDEAALAMIRGAHAKVPVPAGLRGKPFAIDVPVIFEVKN
jgi:TonB family protein